MRIHDITRPLGGGTGVWPGDRAVSIEWTMRLDRGDSVNVAAISTSVHAATHVDGPLHVEPHGRPIGEQPLDAMIGPARVVDARGRDLDAALFDDVGIAGARRVLFRTGVEWPGGAQPGRFAAIAPALARRLVDAGVRLVGTDTPSVDPPDSKTLDTHHVLAAAGVAIVENLVLTDVAAGDYTLVVLPLRLEEADSAPARAVLLDPGALERTPGRAMDTPAER